MPCRCAVSCQTSCSLLGSHAVQLSCALTLELQARCDELETDKRGCLAQLLQLTAYCKHLMEVNHSVNTQLSQLTASLGTNRGWLQPPLTATQAPVVAASFEAGMPQLGSGRLSVSAGALPLPMPSLDLPGLGDYLGLSTEASACPDHQQAASQQGVAGIPSHHALSGALLGASALS